MSDPAPTFGRYRLVRKLAEGGMAEVHLAVLAGPAGFEKQVVVKRMRPELAGQRDYREMFEGEARLMASCECANLVSVLDFGEVDGSYFLALEYVPGVDLHRALAARGSLGQGLAVHVACCVLRGLAHLHSRRDARGEPLNVVHRDVSPQNVLLSASGDVKLGDLGIAKAASRPSRTAPGATRGKLRYMSPEQAAGRPLDGRSDLFSTGVLLHEALTGKSPFAAANEAQMLLAVRDARMAPPAELEARAGRALADAVVRALAKEPGDRFSSAEEMERALAAAAAPAGPSEVARLVAEVVGAEAGEGGRTARARGALSAALAEAAGEGEEPTEPERPGAK